MITLSCIRIEHVSHTYTVGYIYIRNISPVHTLWSQEIRYDD